MIISANLGKTMDFKPREQGPVEILCREIGFAWDRRLERTDLYVAFVRELVAEIAHIRHVQEVAERMGGKGPSEGSSEALGLAARMLEGATREDLIARAAEVHEACHRLNPEGAYPTDHLIDMVSSCASAIRFGLEMPCHSRHAASAADHVWKQAYGVSRYDSHTPEWRKSWARDVLVQAVLSMLPAEQAELERYAALGRACESNGLGWYNEDGEMRFQAPSDVIEDLAFEKGFTAALKNPPKHDYWMAGEPDCPRDIKASNGELHTLRCKRCGHDNPLGPICTAA